MIGILLLLPLQYGVVGLVGVLDAEPWPAIVLPGFKRVLDDGDRHAVRHVACTARFSDGTAAPVATADLLGDLPRSYHAAFFRMYLSPALAPPPDAALWVRERLQALYPDLTPVRLDVVWEELTYRFGDASDAARRVPVDSLWLDLR